jgi:hypothetical protein
MNKENKKAPLLEEELRELRENKKFREWWREINLEQKRANQPFEWLPGEALRLFLWAESHKSVGLGGQQAEPEIRHFPVQLSQES